MGAVYEAIDDHIANRTAIKILHAEWSMKKDIADRFFNEARAANIIRHPGIVTISQFGHLPSGSAYIVMEYLDGASLRQRLEGGVTRLQALRLARQIASALAAAHAKKIIHRDLKPDNVMVITDSDIPGGERTKILDFGIAKIAEEHWHQAGQAPVTMTGQMLGTPLYMSPEQCRSSRAVDDRADVYALGVILYQMLSGRVPFVGDGVGDIIVRHLFQEPQPLRELAPELDADVAALVHEMLAKDAVKRPAMAQVVSRLDAALGGSVTAGGPSALVLPQATSAAVLTIQSAPRRQEAPPRRTLTLFVVGGVVVLGGVGFWLGRGREPAVAPVLAESRSATAVAPVIKPPVQTPDMAEPTKPPVQAPDMVEPTKPPAEPEIEPPHPSTGMESAQTPEPGQRSHRRRGHGPVKNSGKWVDPFPSQPKKEVWVDPFTL